MIFNKRMNGLVLALACILVPVMSNTIMATPYASGIQLNGSSSTFILNEGGANVSIVYNGSNVQSLGILEAGTHTFDATLGNTWQIVCSKSTPAEWTLISDDLTPQNQYYHPKGVAVNRNSAGPCFGRIYVTNSLAGDVASIPNGRRTDIGLFVMGADSSDILGQGDTPASGGIDWDPKAFGISPFKITIAPDDSIYIADWSDSHSGLWRSHADPQANFDEILENLGRDEAGLCSNHGSIASTWVEGIGAGTVLYTLDEDWPDAAGTYGVGRGDILRYNIGTATSVSDVPEIQVEDGTNSTGNPSESGLIVNGLMDLVRDEDGSWWVSQYRYSEAANAPSLLRFLDGATGPVYNSGADDNLPTLTVSNGNIDIHNDLDMLALGAAGGYGVYLLDISDPANPALLETLPQTGTADDVAFDAAGNVYVVSSTTETLRIWSPGGNWITKTGSDGSFILEDGDGPPTDSADFDGDGDVDGADFLAWQAGYGMDTGATPANGDANGDAAVDHVDLAVWVDQFGAPPISTESADFDGDGDVDGADFLAWQAGYGMASGATSANGDANADGAVNNADLAIWMAQFGKIPGGVAGTPIPEPSSILLALAGLMFLGCYRRGSR